MKYDIDTLHYVNKNNLKSHEQIELMISELESDDVWREFHPDIRRFTCAGPNKKQGRLDYFLFCFNQTIRR